MGSNEFAYIEVSPAERQKLFMRKLGQCQIMFDFNDPAKDLRGKEIKRQALQELLEYVATGRGVITDMLYPDVIRMVSDLGGMDHSEWPLIHIYA